MECVENHFRKEIENIMWKQDEVLLPVEKDVNLKTMAQKAMNYFLHTPRPEFNYACRFHNNLLKFPPGSQGEDLVAHGDTDVRMESVLPGLRKLSGMTENFTVDEGLHRRIMSYVKEDNLSHTPMALACAPDIPGETIAVSLWTTGLTIRSLTERWIYCMG